MEHAVLVSEMTFLRDEWHPVAEVAALTGPQAVRLLGADFVVWPAGDGSFAMADPFCPHRSAHLAGGWVSDGQVVCPYHGWRFDADGRCTLVPQMDEGLPVPPRAALRTYPTVACYGMVWACIGEHPVADGPPRWPEADEHPEWRFVVEFFERWNVSAPRIIDNNLDASHVAYVHRSTFGDPSDAQLPPVTVEPMPGGGFRSRLSTEQRGVGVQNGRTTDETARLRRDNEVELLRPLTSRTRLSYHGVGPDYSFYGAATPIDDQHSMYLRIVALGGSEEEQPWDVFHAFGTRVKEEDRVILESTVPDFPIDVTSEVHLRSDRVTLEYRRYLAAVLRGAPLTRTTQPEAVPA